VEKMVDLRTKLSSLDLDNPLIPASGCYGFGQDFAPLYDLNILGSISFKGTTVEPREGNALPRIAECPMGMLNSVGLQNPGVKVVVEEELPALKKIFHKPLVANISGFSFDEFSILAEEMDRVENVGLLEVNISCPNVHNGGMAFGTDAKNVAEVCKRVKEKTKKPVYMKLSPNVTDITEMAKAAEAAGADGISLINTLLGMRIDIKRRRPVLANKVGGYSGPGVFPIALRMVYQVRKAVQIPIIGMGGIASAEDVIEMMMAGASAVEIGAENLVHPYICRDILENLPILCEELGISSLQEIIADLDRGMRKQFHENFSKIQVEFNKVFRVLFGGGQGRLEMEEGEDVLESGIRIVAEPPGKKLQNMMLLSGGERALTAIALLFAILKINPSPFCILDEIEAALDDVNVYRYAEYLKKLNKLTQFLIITHRKGSMEAAGAVYGVTMEENGISKMLSISLKK